MLKLVFCFFISSFDFEYRMKMKKENHFHSIYKREWFEKKQYLKKKNHKINHC